MRPGEEINGIGEIADCRVVRGRGEEEKRIKALAVASSPGAAAAATVAGPSAGGSACIIIIGRALARSHSHSSLCIVFLNALLYIRIYCKLLLFWRGKTRMGWTKCARRDNRNPALVKPSSVTMVTTIRADDVVRCTRQFHICIWLCPSWICGRTRFKKKKKLFGRKKDYSFVSKFDDFCKF